MTPEKKEPRQARKEKLLAKLKRCADNWDAESAHADADSALLDYINDPDVTNAYDAVSKWYA